MKNIKNNILKKYMKGYRRKVLFNKLVVDKLTINYDDHTTYEFTITDIEEIRKAMN